MRLLGITVLFVVDLFVRGFWVGFCFVLCFVLFFCFVFVFERRGVLLYLYPFSGIHNFMLSLFYFCVESKYFAMRC